MYAPDLSPYAYATGTPCPGVLAVGWLQRGHEYARGRAPTDFLPSLRKCFRHAVVNRMRGWHECDLCWTSDCPTHVVGSVRIPGTGQREATVDDEGSRVPLGAAELWLPGDGVIFAAPDLLLHYVERHDYLPPGPFIDAVLSFRPGAWNVERVFSEKCGSEDPESS